MHFIRLLSTMRFLGMTLLMLWIGQFQFDGEKSAPAAHRAKAHHQVGRIVPAASGLAALANLTNRTDTVPPAAAVPSAYTSVFHRLLPGITMIPRMNRVPKPKSVHRTFARSPGAPAVLAPYRSIPSMNT